MRACSDPARPARGSERSLDAVYSGSQYAFINEKCGAISIDIHSISGDSTMSICGSSIHLLRCCLLAQAVHCLPAQRDWLLATLLLFCSEDSLSFLSSSSLCALCCLLCVRASTRGTYIKVSVGACPTQGRARLQQYWFMFNKAAR